MYYGKKKGIIIAIIIVVLIIIIGVVGVFLYLKTDLFKSNETLFLKYMGQTLENLEYVENSQMSQIDKLQQQMPYMINGTLSFNQEEENTDTNSDISLDLKATLEAKVNEKEKKSYAKTQILHNENNLFTLEYANNDNIYALKSDEIVTAFLGIENSNLKVLAQKMPSIDYDTAYGIPDEIKIADINELIAVTEEEKQHIQETYLPVLEKNIAKECYTKDNDIMISKNGVNYNTTGYKLNLNSEQLKQIEVAILETLKQDSITLNLITTKAKLLGLDEAYTQINQLTQYIQQQIQSIQNSTTLLENGLSITVYIEDGKVITTELIIRNDTKITIYGENTSSSSNYYILMEKLDSTNDYGNKIELKYEETKNSMQSTINTSITVDDITNINIYIDNTGTATEKYLNTNCEITINEYKDEKETSSTITYNQEMKFQDDIGKIIEVNRNNCGVLNDYTTEQLQVLIQSLQARIQTLFTQKVEQIILQEATNQLRSNLSNINNQNNVQQ